MSILKVQNGYKCGICGDNWRDSRPRPNELGGTFGSTGIIPRTYESNGIMPVSIQLTTHHQGWFEFKLCEIGPNETTENEACFDSSNSILELESDKSPLRGHKQCSEYINNDVTSLLDKNLTMRMEVETYY